MTKGGRAPALPWTCSCEEVSFCLISDHHFCTTPQTAHQLVQPHEKYQKLEHNRCTRCNLCNLYNTWHLYNILIILLQYSRNTFTILISQNILKYCWHYRHCWQCWHCWHCWYCWHWWHCWHCWYRNKLLGSNWSNLKNVTQLINQCPLSTMGLRDVALLKIGTIYLRSFRSIKERSIKFHNVSVICSIKVMLKVLIITRTQTNLM